MTYLWQLPDWPNFVWDDRAFERTAYDYAVEASRLMGAVGQLSQQDQTDAVIDLMVSEAIKTSQIEGEHFDRSDVRSSIRNQLGLNAKPEAVRDPKAQGIAALMVSVRQAFAEPLTEARLCEWQDKIIVGPYDRTRLEAGRYRTTPEPMQIISGAIGKERVHYEAPPSAQVPAEMARFVSWFNASRDLKGIVRAGVAHLYFECIHPFADGNGRVGRAISEVALSQELGRPALISLSTTIQGRRQEYYDALARASRDTLDITEWLVWFTALVLDAQREVRDLIATVLAKARFWERHTAHLNPRQAKVLNRMFRDGLDSFEGGINAQKYMKLTDCSKATATRDLTELLHLGALKKLPGSGRSTRYDIALPDTDLPQ